MSAEQKAERLVRYSLRRTKALTDASRVEEVGIANEAIIRSRARECVRVRTGD